MTRWGFVIGLMLLGACSESGPQQSKDAIMANPLQVRTLFGELQGDWADTKQHIRVFKGVPYARPPVG